MKLQVVSVYDKAAAAYMRPFFVNAIGQAIRSFQDEIVRQADDNPMCRHPDDYQLFRLGTFDDEVGAFESLQAVELLASGSQMKFIPNGGSDGSGRG